MVCPRFLKKETLRFYVCMLKIGLIGFGGGSILIPLLHKESVGIFVDEEAFYEDVLIASVSPGALPVEIASGIGYRQAGRLGMLIGAIAMALPGTVATILLMECGVLDLPWIHFISSAVLLWVLWLLIRFVLRTPKKRIIALVFAVTCGKNLWKILSLPGNALYLTSIQVYMIAFVIQLFKGKLKLSPDRAVVEDLLFLLFPVAAMTILFPDVIGYIYKGALSVIISFGGGDAYLTVTEAMFIETGMIDKSVFYGEIVPLVNMLPGSILCKTLPAIGFVIGGRKLAILGFWMTVVMSCSAFRAAKMFKFEQWTWIRPIVAGLMCTVALSLILQIFGIA